MEAGGIDLICTTETVGTDVTIFAYVDSDDEKPHIYKTLLCQTPTTMNRIDGKEGELMVSEDGSEITTSLSNGEMMIESNSSEAEQYSKVSENLIYEEDE